MPRSDPFAMPRGDPVARYRFEPCDGKVPPFVAIPDGHRDACLLPPERKREVWEKRIAAEIGVAAS